MLHLFLSCLLSLVLNLILDTDIELSGIVLGLSNVDYSSHPLPLNNLLGLLDIEDGLLPVGLFSEGRSRQQDFFVTVGELTVEPADKAI